MLGDDDGGSPSADGAREDEKCGAAAGENT